MNYRQTLETLYNMMPDFHRVGAEAYKPGLDRIRAFMAELGNPQDYIPCIHVAGTNGKGSVSHMLASVLTAAGYRTGLYTSPHIVDFRERIRVDGEMIPEQAVMDFASGYLARMERLHLSFFEATVAMAFTHFRNEEVDIAVIETGLGGRLDATNIITPLISVITNIGFDHTSFLGESLAGIAGEKAGIIKPGITVIIGERDPATDFVFIEKASAEGSPISFSEDMFRYVEDGNLPAAQNHESTYPVLDLQTGVTTIYTLDLCGSYQRKNLATALSSLKALNGCSPFRLSEENIYDGLRTAALSTGLRGRWEIAGHHPLIVMDTGHNPHGLRETMRQIETTSHENLYIVLGLASDKDLSAIIPLLPRHAYYFFTRPQIDRGMAAEKLAAAGREAGLNGEIASDAKQALNKAKGKATEADMIYIGGSNYIVADVLTAPEI